MEPRKCGPEASSWIEYVFQDCVYNFRDYAGFFMGLASILTWMVAQVPQIWTNFRNKSAEALSPWFLAEWLLGDTCNLIGCLLTGDQLVTQTYTAVYFICADICLVVQYVYFGTLQKRRLRMQRNQQYRMRRSHEEGHSPTAGLPGTPASGSRYPSLSSLGQPKPRVLLCVAVILLGGQLWQSNQRELHGANSAGGRAFGRGLLGQSLEALDLAEGGHPNEFRKYIGQVIGWVSSAFYLGSRLSQIYKNWSRQSAEGLSIAMFVCAVVANCLYGCGILLRAYTWRDLVTSAPWLLGSLGTVALDLIIFSQFSQYNNERKEEEEGASLLVVDGGLPE